MGGIVMTNDGNCILREVDVSHPAAKSMIELARAQDEEVGDGTTSVIVLAGEMLAIGATATGATATGATFTTPEILFSLDDFRVHPKGQGIVCARLEGLAPYTFVSEYIGELYLYKQCLK